MLHPFLVDNARPELGTHEHLFRIEYKCYNCLVTGYGGNFERRIKDSKEKEKWCQIWINVWHDGKLLGHTPLTFPPATSPEDLGKAMKKYTEELAHDLLWREV